MAEIPADVLAMNLQTPAVSVYKEIARRGGIGGLIELNCLILQFLNCFMMVRWWGMFLAFLIF